MGFQNRLHDMRTQQTSARQEAALAADQAEEREAERRRVESRRAQALLPEVDEAVRALREDRARSETALRPHMAPLSSTRGPIGIGPIWGLVEIKEKRRFLPGDATYAKQSFTGWWVCTNPFEFEVPVDGDPVVRLIDQISKQPGAPVSFRSFAEVGLYDYRVEGRNEGGPSEIRQRSAADALQVFLDDVMNHLAGLS